LREVEQTYVDKISAKRASARDALDSIPRIVAERGRLVSRFTIHIRQLEDAGNYLLRAYYDANKMARDQNKRVPKRFNAAWKLDGFRAPDVGNGVSINPDTLKAADQALVASIERLQEAFQRAITWVGALGRARTNADIDQLDHAEEVSGDSGVKIVESGPATAS
jgi:hypothetical protein